MSRLRESWSGRQGSKSKSQVMVLAKLVVRDEATFLDGLFLRNINGLGGTDELPVYLFFCC